MKINPKALELIARDMGERKSGWQLVDLLKEVGVPEEIIVYPNTKWRMIKDVFLSLLKNNIQKDQIVFTKILTEFVHPLNLDGNIHVSNSIIEKYNDWLQFDGWKIERKGGDYVFTIHDEITPDEVVEHMLKSNQGKDSKEYDSLKNSKSLEQKVKYNETPSFLTVNGVQVPIPFATNQSSLVKCIVKKQNKRWENDELLEVFGEETGTRKAYDAMRAVNTQVHKVSGVVDFIIYDRKTYFLNPKLATKK